MRAAEIRQAFADIIAADRPTHLAWVGAHSGEEIPHLIAAGIPQITAVEPIPALAAKLRAAYPQVTVVEAACSDRTGTATLHIPRRTNMASLIQLDGATITVPTVRLDNICPDADAAVIDVQGAEYLVLEAAPWPSLRMVMVETCTVDDPTVAPLYGPMVRYMADRGFAEHCYLPRDYDWVQKWAYSRRTNTGGEIRDVVFVRSHL